MPAGGTEGGAPAQALAADLQGVRARASFYVSPRNVMQFSKILDSMVRAGDEWGTDVPDTWLQGRSLFGGIQAAIAVRAMRAVLPRELPLRVLQVTFMAPVGAGAVRVKPALLRVGKSATHVEARLLAGSEVAALVVGIFGSSRPSRVRVVPVQPEIVPERTTELSFVPGMMPSFLQHFSVRWIRGELPFSGSTSRELIGVIGIHDDGPTAPEHVLAIADVPPPVALSHLDKPSAGSSMTWTLEMLRESVADLPLRGFRLDAELVAAEGGYTSQSVMVWGPGGEPVALSRQSMVVFG